MRAQIFTTFKTIRIQVLMMFIALILPLSSEAVSYTWIGGVSSEWGNPSNWSPSTGTPDIGDDVTIQTGAFNPVFEEVTGINNFTINSGSLDLAGFTLLISGSSNFNGGSVFNGGLSCTGAVIFAGTSFSANVTVSSNSISFNGSVFNNPVVITKTGAGSITSAGGNTFESTFSLSNSGSGEVILSNTNPDTYKGSVTLSNSGTGWISAAHAATGTAFNGSLILNSTGSSPGIRFGQGNGTCTLASGQTLQVGVSGFSIGDLFIKNMTQSGSTAQSLTLTGTASLSLETGTTFNAAVTFVAPQLFLDGATFQGTASFTKNGTGNNQSLGGNTFNGTTTFLNSGGGELILGVSNPDTFNAQVTFTNTGSQTTFVAHGSSGNTFNQNIVVNSTGSSRGVRFGQSGGTSTLASGRTITVGGTGFTAGSLRLRNFTQSGTTAQSILLSSGTAALHLESGTTFNGNVNFRFPQLVLSGTTFNGTATLQKNGATSNTGTGGNVFASTCRITNSGSGSLILGSTNADVFNGELSLTSSGSSFIAIAHGGSGHQFNENIEVSSSGASLGVRFGQSGGTSTLADTKTISIGSGGFSSGDLLLRGFTQTGVTAQSLIDFTDVANLYLETSTTFNGDVTFTAPGVYLNGSTFNGVAVITQSGALSVISSGGNVFNAAATLSKTGDGEWVLGSSSADVFEADLTLENSGMDVLYLADGGSGHEFNGNVELNSFGSSGGIRIGQNGGTSTLASGMALQIGSGGFSSGELRIAGLTQVGSTAQNLASFGSGTEIHLQAGNTFNGAVTVACPGVYLDGTTFNSTASITKNGSGPNISAGGNVFNGTTTISATGSGALYMAGSVGDDFNGDVTFQQTTAFTLYPAYNTNSTFSGNITTAGSVTAVNFAASGGRVTMDGGANQTISGDIGVNPVFGNMTINKTANRVTLFVPVSISNNLTLTARNINTTSTYLLTILDNATVTGASHSSFVSGPVRKEGDDAFTFPIGKSSVYRPIGITAPSTTGSQFTANFFFADSDALYSHSSKDGSIDHLSRCEYWTLDRNAGSSSVSVTLTWNTTSCGVTNLADLRVCRWDGSTWRDHGNGGTSGNTTTGSIVSSAAIGSFSPFTLGSSSTENPLPVNLLNFSANRQDDKVLLEWTTLSETNNDYFSIEVSTDAVNFEEVTRVSGAGNSNTLLTYRTFDNNPISGVSYYRLRQVDFDGKSMYSGARVVEMPTLWRTEVLVSPNPVQQQMSIHVDPEIFIAPNIEIRDIQGRLIRDIGMVNIDPQNPLELNLEALQAGLYFVQVSEGSKMAVQRFVKK